MKAAMAADGTAANPLIPEVVELDEPARTGWSSARTNWPISAWYWRVWRRRGGRARSAAAIGDSDVQAWCVIWPMNVKWAKLAVRDKLADIVGWPVTARFAGWRLSPAEMNALLRQWKRRPFRPVHQRPTCQLSNIERLFGRKPLPILARAACTRRRRQAERLDHGLHLLACRQIGHPHVADRGQRAGPWSGRG